MADTFLNIIAKDYDDTKARFRQWTGHIGLMFDEDVFQDTIIKCSKIFGEQTVDKENAVRYFWTAYKTNIIREAQFARNKNKDFDNSLSYSEYEMNCSDFLLSSQIKSYFTESEYNLFLRYADKDIPKDPTERKQMYSVVKRIKRKMKKVLLTA